MHERATSRRSVAMAPRDAALRGRRWRTAPNHFSYPLYEFSHLPFHPLTGVSFSFSACFMFIGLPVPLSL
ncbi:MAG TPA: hypothetical protein VFY83_00370, partial [Anaerolineales bacterium]|nr:hypothetical protein [Anaerolineales bacterium]